MRCLYCDKKLSLLKLTRGDKVCSPEHFDAYQLQLSKAAYERLAGPPVKKTPSAPVTLAPPEEERHIQTEDLAVLPPPAAPSPPYAPFSTSDLIPHPPNAMQLGAVTSAAPEEERHIRAEKLAVPLALPSPPYAPFSTSELVPHPPNSMLLTASELDVPRPKLALPVHDVEFTGNLLNLHLPLGRSDTGPFNLELARQPIAPMDFRPDLTRPPLALKPDFPEIEERAKLEPVETAPPASPRLPYLLAPSFAERTTPAIFVDASSAVPTLSSLAPIFDLDKLLRPDSSGAIPKRTVFAQSTSLQVRDSASLSIQGAPELAFPPDFILPAAKGQAHLERWHVSSRLIGLTSTAVETSWQSMRTLDFDPPNPRALLVRPDAALVQSLRQLRIPLAQLPVSLTISPISPSLNSAPELPRPEEPHRASPVAPAAGTPQQRAPMLPSCLFVSVLETRPLQREVMFVHPPPCPTEFCLRSTLAEFPAGELFPVALCRNQATHFPLPESIAEAAVLPAFQLQPLFDAPSCLKKRPLRVPAPTLPSQLRLTIAWHETHSGLPSGALPKPTLAPPPLRFSGPGTARKLEMVSSVALPAAHDRVFAPAPSVLFAALDVASSGFTALPQIVGDPAGSVKIGLGAPAATWEPRQPASHAARIAKILPVRKSPVLPVAGNWPRLGALPR
jgi:hypothetical protein